MAPFSGRASILVVDDDPDTRFMLRDVLELEGHKVIPAANGREALLRLREGLRPNLILLDVAMPIMDGWQFLAARKEDSALTLIPVVLLTGGSAEEIAAASAGGHRYLRKPVNLATLLEVVEEHC